MDLRCSNCPAIGSSGFLPLKTTWPLAVSQFRSHTPLCALDLPSSFPELIQLFRAHILVSGPADMGVYLGASDPQRLSAMAPLRPSDEHSEMVLQRGRRGNTSSRADILCAAGSDVCPELRARRLGGL